MSTDEYFIKYKTKQTCEPYVLPERTRKELALIDGVEVVYENAFAPIIIANIPENKVAIVKSLDSVIDVSINPTSDAAY